MATYQTPGVTTCITMLLCLFCSYAWGQHIDEGEWESISMGLTRQTNQETKTLGHSYNVYFRFNPDGSYIKRYFIPKNAPAVPLYKHCEITEDKLVRKPIRSESGAPLRMLLIKEQRETGRFVISPRQDTITLYDNAGGVTKIECHLVESRLVLLDTLENRSLYFTLARLADKRKKRTSR